MILTHAQDSHLVVIVFVGDDRHDDHRAVYLGNKEPILALLALLNGRHGSPEHRVRYWTDPKDHPSRVRRSRKDMFEGNGNVGYEAYIHHGFVKHLRYMLLGADMSATVTAAFEEKFGNPERVSYDDVLELAKSAPALIRRFGLRLTEECDEFLQTPASG